MNKDDEGFQAVLDRGMKRADEAGDAKTRVVRTTLVGAQMHPAISQQLGIMAIKEGKTKRELLEEALDLLFMKRHEPRVDELVNEWADG